MDKFTWFMIIYAIVGFEFLQYKIRTLEKENDLLNIQLESEKSNNAHSKNNLNVLQENLEQCYQKNNTLAEKFRENKQIVYKEKPIIIEKEIVNEETLKEIIDILNAPLPSFAAGVQ